MTYDDLSTAGKIALLLSVGTLPGCIWFIWLYWTDGWHRHWFGRSLMAIAFGVLLACVGAIMFRLVGDFSLREWLGVAIWGLTSFGMWTRAGVLYNAKRKDKLKGTRP